MAKKWSYNNKLMTYFMGKEGENKRRQNNGQFLFFLSNLPFWDIYYNKNATHSLFSVWSFLLVHIRVTSNRGPKDFIKLDFLMHRTMEVGPWSRMLGKGHLPWSDVMVHGAWCKRALCSVLVGHKFQLLCRHASLCHIGIKPYNLSNFMKCEPTLNIQRIYN